MTAGRSAHRALVAGTLTVAATLSACGLPGGDAACSEFRFDRAAWREGLVRGPRDNPRLPIARDLLRCDVLEGKTRRELRALLGKPGASQSTPRSYAYVVGFDIIDPRYLRVTFSDRETVRRAAIDGG